MYIDIYIYTSMCKKEYIYIYIMYSLILQVREVRLPIIVAIILVIIVAIIVVIIVIIIVVIMITME